MRGGGPFPSLLQPGPPHLPSPALPEQGTGKRVPPEVPSRKWPNAARLICCHFRRDDGGVMAGPWPWLAVLFGRDRVHRQALRACRCIYYYVPVGRSRDRRGRLFRAIIAFPTVAVRFSVIKQCCSTRGGRCIVQQSAFLFCPGAIKKQWPSV